MQKNKSFTAYARTALIIAILLVIGAAAQNAVADSGGATGKIALMMSGSPSEQYDHLWVRVTQIELLPAQGSTSIAIFSPDAPVVFDLNDLRPELGGILLTIADVPAGSYSKFRLEVAENDDPQSSYSHVVVGENEVAGGLSEFTYFKLSSGKIDFNPRGPFEVLPNSALNVTLDIDHVKPLHVSQGNQKNFRPVVFVDIEQGELVEKCPSILSGTISDVTYADDQVTVTGFELTLTHGQVAIPIAIDDQVLIRNQDGTAGTEALVVGETAYVRGSIQGGELLATVVVVGNLNLYEGIVFDPVQNNQLTLMGSTDLYTLFLDSDTVILGGCEDILAPDGLMPGMKAYVLGADIDGILTAVAILVRPLTGELTAMAPTVGGYDLTFEIEMAYGTEIIPVFLPDDALIEIQGGSPLSAADVMQLIDCNARIAEISYENFNLPLLATGLTLLPEPEPLDAVVLEVRPLDREIVTDQGVVRLTADALMYRVTDMISQVDIANIVAGDHLLLYGLSLCPQSATDPVFTTIGGLVI